MTEYTEAIKEKMESLSSILDLTPGDHPKSHVIDLEGEDPELICYDLYIAEL